MENPILPKFHWWLFTLVIAILCGCKPQQTVSPNTHNQHSEIASSGGSVAATGPILLTNVTQTAKLRFTHSHGGSGRHYMIETFVGGCAFLDYDNDGWQDIFLVQGAPLPEYSGPVPLKSALYHNNKNGTFTDVTTGSGLDIEMYGVAPSVGDYDNDGWPDLYITALGGNRLFHNEGGKFRDVTKRANVGGKDWSTSSMWLDYDRDGWLDLFVCRYTDYSLSKDIICKAGGKIIYCDPGRYQPTHSLLYRNNGNGTFSDVTTRSGIRKSSGRALGVAPIDANEDGLIDIYVSCDQTLNLLFINNGNGTFREAAVSTGTTTGIKYGGMGTDSSDYDNDGHTDIVVTNFAREPISIYNNKNKGTFTTVGRTFSFLYTSGARYVKWGCRFVDLDLDGFQDLFVVNGHVNDTAIDGDHVGYRQPSQLFRNVRGEFMDISRQGGSFFEQQQVGRGAAFGDYDNDGDSDILVACNNEPAILLRNDSPRRTQWVQLDLHGSARPQQRGCNRDALGALVRVRANGMTQTQYVRGGTSYMADHDRRMLFGIGQDKHAQVEIRWPCGALQKLRADVGKATLINENGCKLRKGKTLDQKM